MIFFFHEKRKEINRKKKWYEKKFDIGINDNGKKKKCALSMRL